MPADLIQRINPDELYFPLLERALDVLAACRKRGEDYWAISGARTFAEQAALYFQGRTTPGAIVTHARPGESAHNYGCAVDFSRDRDVERSGLQPDWDAPAYAILGEEAAKVGLEWAGNWKRGPVEYGHLQWPGLGPARMRLLRDSLRRDGMQGAWCQLNGLPVEGLA